MSAQVQKISSKATSEAGRDVLLLLQINDFCLLKRPKQFQIEAIKELFYAMIGSCSHEVRRNIAIALSNNPYAPRPLVFFLALEPVTIAAPVLLHSPLLDDSDLIAIMDNTGAEHARVISHRRGLSSTILAKLDEIFPSTLQYEEQAIPAQAGKNALLAAPTSKVDASDKLMALAAQGGRLGSHNNQRQNGETPMSADMLGRSLLVAARERQYDRFAEIVETACKLNAQIVQKLIDEKNAGILACLLHVLKIPALSSSRIILLLTPIAGRNYRIFKRIMHEFGKLDREAELKFFRELDPAFSVDDVHAAGMNTQGITARTETNRREGPHNRVENPEPADSAARFAS